MEWCQWLGGRLAGMDAVDGSGERDPNAPPETKGGCCVYGGAISGRTTDTSYVTLLMREGWSGDVSTTACLFGNVWSHVDKYTSRCDGWRLLWGAGWVPDIWLTEATAFCAERIRTILNCTFVNCVVAKLYAVWSVFQIWRRLWFVNAIQTYKNEKSCNYMNRWLFTQIEKSRSRNHQILNKQTVHSAAGRKEKVVKRT